MRELIDGYGIKAIKIWPFDGAAHRNRNQFVTHADIEQALFPVRKLRDTFGEDIEILMEFHSNWNLTSAVRIAHALEPYKPMWLEDMLLPGNFAQYRQLAEATALPLTISERLAGRFAYEDLMESRAAKFIMLDLCWCGGLSEGRKIATMAEAFHLPIAPHTAAGPLLFYASTPPDHGRDQRLDPGKLPEILGARLAGHAREPHHPEKRRSQRNRPPRFRHEDQAGDLEPPGRGTPGKQPVNPNSRPVPGPPVGKAAGKR